MNIYLFCPLRHINRLSDRSLISQAPPFADEACETNRLLEGTGSCWKTRKRFFRTVCSHLVLCFNMSPRCVRPMGVRRALALQVDDAKQAMGEGPVATGLNGPVAMALITNCISYTGQKLES